MGCCEVDIWCVMLVLILLSEKGGLDSGWMDGFSVGWRWHGIGIGLGLGVSAVCLWINTK
jgi:hypothetical protein